MSAGSAGGGKKPMFPDRPTHPDFLKLSKIVIANDKQIEGSSDQEAEFEKIMAGVADGQSVAYMAVNRSGLFFQKAGIPMRPEFNAIYAGLWLDGFVSGVLFEREKS